MQFGDGAQTCMVYQADHPPQGNCKSAIEALIVGINVHEEEVDSRKVGCHERVFSGSRSRWKVGGALEGMERGGTAERACGDLGGCRVQHHGQGGRSSKQEFLDDI